MSTQSATMDRAPARRTHAAVAWAVMSEERVLSVTAIEGSAEALRREGRILRPLVFADPAAGAVNAVAWARMINGEVRNVTDSKESVEALVREGHIMRPLVFGDDVAPTPRATVTLTIDSEYLRETALALRDRRNLLRRQRNKPDLTKSQRAVIQIQLERTEDALHHVCTVLGEFV